MTDVLSEQLYFNGVTSVSALDGIPYKTMPNAVNTSAYLGTLGDMLFKLLNRIDSASTTLISGGSAGAVALGLPSTIGHSTVAGLVHGMPFHLTNIGVSGQPASGISTASNQIRKVGVALVLSAFPPGSSFDATGGALQFVIWSAMITGALSCLSGGQSAFFNSVPTPRFSAMQVPVGVLLIPNSFAASAGIANTNIDTDARVWAGMNLSLMLPTVAQP